MITQAMITNTYLFAAAISSLAIIAFYWFFLREK